MIHIILPVRAEEDERRLERACDARRELNQRVERVQEDNWALKKTYDVLLQRQRAAETSLREAEDRGGVLLEDMIQPKQQAADRMNSLNEHRSRCLNAPTHL